MEPVHVIIGTTEDRLQPCTYCVQIRRYLLEAVDVCEPSGMFLIGVSCDPHERIGLLTVSAVPAGEASPVTGITPAVPVSVPTGKPLRAHEYLIVTVRPFTMAPCDKNQTACRHCWGGFVLSLFKCLSYTPAMPKLFEQHSEHAQRNCDISSERWSGYRPMTALQYERNNHSRGLQVAITYTARALRSTSHRACMTSSCQQHHEAIEADLADCGYCMSGKCIVPTFLVLLRPEVHVQLAPPPAQLPLEAL